MAFMALGTFLIIPLSEKTQKMFNFLPLYLVRDDFYFCLDCFKYPFFSISLIDSAPENLHCSALKMCVGN